MGGATGFVPQQVGQTDFSFPPRIQKSVPVKVDNSVGDWLEQSQHQVAGICSHRCLREYGCNLHRRGYLFAPYGFGRGDE